MCLRNDTCEVPYCYIALAIPHANRVAVCRDDEIRSVPRNSASNGRRATRLLSSFSITDRATAMGFTRGRTSSISSREDGYFESHIARGLYYPSRQHHYLYFNRCLSRARCHSTLRKQGLLLVIPGHQTIR